MKFLESVTIQAFLAVFAISSFVGLVYLLMFVGQKDAPFRDLLVALAGILAGIAKDVYGFYFGSSSGSKDKDSAMAKLALNGKQDAAP